jgi:hypothetical protein
VLESVLVVLHGAKGVLVVLNGAEGIRGCVWVLCSNLVLDCSTNVLPAYYLTYPIDVAII